MDSIKESPSIKTSSSSFWEGVKDCIPTLLGYISIGIAMGVVGASSGLSTLEIFLLSVFVYAGASQFIICAMLVSGSSFSSIVLTTFVVNLRHLLLSSALAPSFSHYSVWTNIRIGTLLTDESFGVAISRMIAGKNMSDRWMHGLNVTAYLFWIISCTVGSLIGGWLKQPEALGLDFALTSMFVALLILHLQTIQSSKLKHYLFLIALMIICMLVLTTFMSSSLAVIVSTIIVATIGVVTDK